MRRMKKQNIHIKCIVKMVKKLKQKLQLTTKNMLKWDILTKNETHSFMTKDMNKSKKDAKGEKEIVDPAPKMKFKEAYKKVKKRSYEYCW
jgi:hypothetical protein